MQEIKFVPKYQEIIGQIRERVATGELMPGDKLPVRDILCKQFSVTRTTIDRAFAELIRSGELVASRRNGTFVASRQIDKAAVIGWKESILLHRSRHERPTNYLALFEAFVEGAGSESFVFINPEKACGNPSLLSRYQRVLWSSTDLAAFLAVAGTVHDPERFILLNREYAGYNFISTDHQRAARELTTLFLRNLPESAAVFFLDLPISTDLSGRDLWLCRRQGFIDACEEHRRFYRVLELDNADTIGNIELLRRYLGTCNRQSPGIVISPTRALTGCVLGLLNAMDGRMYRDIYYGDFDNDHSLFTYGQSIVSVLQNFMEIGTLAARHLSDPIVRLHVPYQIANSPF